jgi:hypothetical protein
VETGWTFALPEARLFGPEGAECPLKGVPVEAGGGKMLVEGRELTLHVHPDKDTGRLSFALAAAYQIPAAGGAFALRIADFPPVVLTVGAKEEKEEAEKSEGTQPDA